VQNDSNKSNNLLARALKSGFLNIWHVEIKSVRRLFRDKGVEVVNTPPSDTSDRFPLKRILRLLAKLLHNCNFDI
jgi:methylmalonyl-CoA mutase cobalamin-binding subunit